MMGLFNKKPDDQSLAITLDKLDDYQATLDPATQLDEIKKITQARKDVRDEQLRSDGHIKAKGVFDVLKSAVPMLLQIGSIGLVLWAGNQGAYMDKDMTRESFKIPGLLRIFGGKD